MNPPRKPYPPTTPAARALNAVGGKWALLIVQALAAAGRPVRFVDLQRDRVHGISTEQLRVNLERLTADGIVTRTRYRELPPRVDYDLTDKGRELRPVLDALTAWATRWTEAP